MDVIDQFADVMFEFNFIVIVNKILSDDCVFGLSFRVFCLVLDGSCCRLTSLPLGEVSPRPRPPQLPTLDV